MLALFAAACVLVQPTPAAPTPPTAPAKPTREDRYPTPTITVIDAGRNPRPVRVSATKGDSWTQTWTIHGEEKATLDGVPRPAPPRVGDFTATLKLEVVEGTGEGARVRWKVESARALPGAGASEAAKAAGEAAATAATGLAGELAVTDRGVMTDGTDGTPEQQAGELTASLLRNWAWSCVPFPAEAVGVGGKWKAESTRKNESGALLRRAATYEITALTQTSVRLHVTGSSTLEAQTAPQGQRVKAVTVAETSEIEYQLTRPVPAAADVTTETDAKFESTNTPKPVEFVILRKKRIQIAEGAEGAK
ncbi:hypothetical protein PHYC_02123 [Phycisphaerales bacterium]|nr:hypothetical protein PHYC_02123 [Phycisphaerales bacterium]